LGSTGERVRDRRFLLNAELQAPWVLVLVAAVITWVCFSAVIGGLLQFWTAAVLVSATIACVAWYLYAAHRQFLSAITELQEILEVTEAHADYARVYQILHSLRRYDGRIEKLLDLTDRFILGQTRWDDYREKMLESLKAVEGVPFLGRRA
jgi:hypothetical protein